MSESTEWEADSGIISDEDAAAAYQDLYGEEQPAETGLLEGGDAVWGDMLKDNDGDGQADIFQEGGEWASGDDTGSVFDDLGSVLDDVSGDLMPGGEDPWSTETMEKPWLTDPTWTGDTDGEVDYDSVDNPGVIDQT